ncbi:class III signal peptide-containing protein [Thermococcus sp. Bubb.Bath]|uniref:class III signal peptide-containing protein n=1 Tax=Thermococcus sp. Bubb.Bath TaxID=1638242 RepID=UPI00143C72E0|nr:class III signal peptide-containing protein [Thermococcus sp. Bubb.Bath]
MQRKAQGSVEYLFVLGATIAIVVLVVGYIAKFSHNAAQTQTERNNDNVNSVMSKVRNISSGEING